MMCVLFMSLQRKHSGDGCDLTSTLCKYDLTSTLCKYDLRTSNLCVLSWTKGEARKYLFRDAHVWWRCAQ